MTITAFASTCSSLVSNLIGSGEARYVMPTIRQHVRLCTGIVWPVILLIACLPTYVLRIYTDMPDLVEAAVPTLWYSAPATSSNAPDSFSSSPYPVQVTPALPSCWKL